MRAAFRAAFFSALLLLGQVWPLAQAWACDLAALGIQVDATVSPGERCLVFGDLVALRTMVFDGQGEWLRRLYGTSGRAGTTGEELFRWVTSRITHLSHGAVEGAIAANLGHAVRSGGLKGNFPAGAIRLTDDYARQSPLKRIGTLIHEARHTDGDRNLAAHRVDGAHPDTSHVGCRTAGLASANGSSSRIPHDSGCDPDIHGAYGVEWVFYGNVAHHCASCTAETRDEARRLASGSFVHLLEIPDIDIQ